jgi:TnpA family transposase
LIPNTLYTVNVYTNRQADPSTSHRFHSLWQGWGATNQRDEQEISMLALHLVQICMVYINTSMIQRVLNGQDWMSRLTKENAAG